MARRGHPAHRKEEYLDLMEKYLQKLPLTVQRGKRPGDENRLLLDGGQYKKLPCGEAKLLVHAGGYMRFEYKVQIRIIEANRDLLLRAINGLNLSGSGGLSFYLLEYEDKWWFEAEARLQMDSCSCTSARREAAEVYERINHVNYALEKLKEQLPEFFGEEALANPQQREYGINIDALQHPYWITNLDADDFPEAADAEEESDFVDADDMDDADDVDELLERFERDADSLSGSELVRLHLGLSNRLEAKQAEVARLEALQHLPPEDDVLPQTEDENMPEWDDEWGDEAEILRRADEEGTEGWELYKMFQLLVAQGRERERQNRGLPTLYQPKESAGTAEEDDPDDKPIRNIPLIPRKW